MFSTFTTDHGSLIVRAVDIRQLRDTPRGCELTSETTPGHVVTSLIHGTADENMARLRQEETEALIAAENVRRQQPDIWRDQQPVKRGRQSLRMRA